MDDPQGTARVRHNLGVVLIDQGDLEGAELLFNQALETNRGIGAFANAAASELDIGVAYHLGGRLHDAEKDTVPLSIFTPKPMTTSEPPSP